MKRADYGRKRMRTVLLTVLMVSCLVAAVGVSRRCGSTGAVIDGMVSADAQLDQQALENVEQQLIGLDGLEVLALDVDKRLICVAFECSRERAFQELDTRFVRSGWQLVDTADDGSWLYVREKGTGGSEFALVIPQALEEGTSVLVEWY